MPAPTDILTLAFPLLSQRIAVRHLGEEHHIDMRVLIAGLVIALGIAEIAMSATARSTQREPTSRDRPWARRSVRIRTSVPPRRARMIRLCDRRTDEMSWRT